MKLFKEIEDSKIRVIAIDFDGTLCERATFPQIGEPKLEMIEWVKTQRENGVKVILWTCREGEDLNSAIRWCKDYGMEFDSVNENLPTCRLKTRKVVADLYVDDRGCVPF